MNVSQRIRLSALDASHENARTLVAPHCGVQPEPEEASKEALAAGLQPPPAAERAGVVVIRQGRVALIHRVRRGRTYWVVPGGSVDPGESVADAARREGEEELGVPIELGRLVVQLDHRSDEGWVQRQWYFTAAVATEAIAVTGPELSHPEDSGTYAAVWVEVGRLPGMDVRPAAVAELIAASAGEWPPDVVVIDETCP